ncbi:hypothetical protein M4D54_02765 [Brachybacterium sp. p3-SID1565]|uniref:VanZ-like domain-containing protein n=1 Tax=Brachybacterium epidermidis TaxID=2781983 RepID=A0ABR9W1P5_9MICO|nr:MULTISPECIES: hypothetical protein [Brachybacterium]MBE9403365.1 hypothetical protein [Brachybacterium epidermidis]MCT1384559.1 hypothetical protein [Brachybacterium sp. p3-SID1565]
MRAVGRAVLRLAVRWSGLLMAAGLALAGLWVEAAVAMLVALGQVLAWRMRLPRAWEAAASITAMAAAVSSYLHLYERWTWWDLPVHAALTAVVSVMAAWMVDVRWRRRASPRPWLMVISGFLLALVWEVLEWWGHQVVDPRVHIAPADTAGDVIAGLLGASAAAWWWHRRSAAGPSGPVRSPSRSARASSDSASTRLEAGRSVR